MDDQQNDILIVEDTSNVRELLEVVLKFKGYSAVTAENGQEALQIIAKKKPALIITDILMPKMDGYTLIQTLRTNPETCNIPIVVVSATYITPDDKNFALNLGIAKFIEKPIDTEDFLLTVAEILTQGVESDSAPLEEKIFYSGYRERLENKYRYKNSQIARTKRLLRYLPDKQVPAFEELLQQAIRDRNEIKVELERLYNKLKELGSKED